MKKKPPRGAFSKFILKQPLDMPAADVVARGQKAGLYFSHVTVRTARDRARSREGVGPAELPILPGRQLPFATAPEPEPEAPTTAAAFVRSLPSDMPPDEVIAKGAEAGLNVSIATVYNTRSLARRKDEHEEKKPGPRGLGRSPKREFVRSCPLDMPTEEVVARAKAAGLELTKQQVHQGRFAIRNQALRGVQEGLPGVQGAMRSAARVSRAPKALKPTGDPSREAKRQQFKALILELGMDDAESIWEDFASIRNGIRR